MMISISNDILFGFTEWVKAPQGYFLRGALQHVYAYMDVGGRATQEQLPSSPVCPLGYVKSSLPRVLRARYLCTPHKGGTEVHARQRTKGAAISSIFHYASQANTTAWTQEVERRRKPKPRKFMFLSGEICLTCGSIRSSVFTSNGKGDGTEDR